MNPFRPGLGGNPAPSSTQNPDQRKPRKKKAVTTQAALSSIPKPYLATAPTSSLHPTTTRPLNSNPNANLILPSSYIKAARPGREGGYAAGLLSPPNVVPGGSSLPPRNVGRRERPSSPATATHGLTVLQARNPNASSSALSLPLQSSSSPRTNAADEPRPRRKRRIVRPQVSTGEGEEGEAVSGRTREPPPATREEGSRRALGRGASMRRVNLWDDVPDSEEAPPPFPYPSPSSVRQPPSFAAAGSSSLNPVPEVPPALPPERERSPPPSWEVAVAALGPPVSAQPVIVSPPAPPSNAGSDGETIFASAPSSPTGTTVTTNPDADEDEDEEQRLDRIMWNADLLAGYTLAERVERERMRRSRTVRRGKGLAGARGGLRPMEPSELPPAATSAPTRRLPFKTSSTEAPSRSYAATTPKQPEAAPSNLTASAPSKATCQSPSQVGSPPPVTSPVSASQAIVSPKGQAAATEEPTTPTQSSRNLPVPARDASPPPSTEAALDRTTSLTFESQNIISTHRPSIVASDTQPLSTNLGSSQVQSVLNAEGSIASVSISEDLPASPPPLEATLPLDTSQATETRFAATPPDSLPIPLTTLSRDQSSSTTPLELTPVSSLPKPIIPLKTPAKPAPLFSKRPTISVSRPSPLSSGRARVQRRSSVSRSTGSAASSRNDKTATHSPRTRLTSGQASISATPPSMYSKKTEADPVTSITALPPNREAALRRRDLLAKAPEPLVLLPAQEIDATPVRDSLQAELPRSNPAAITNISLASGPNVKIAKAVESTPLHHVEPAAQPLRSSPAKDMSPKSVFKTPKREPVLIDLGESTSLPLIQATSPMNFGVELEKMLSGYGREGIKIEPSSPVAGPSRLPFEAHRSVQSRDGPPPPPPPWRARQNAERDELAEAFDDLMNFGSQGDSKASSPTTEIARKPSVSTKRLAPTRRPAPPPPPSRALKNKARNNHPYLSGSPSSSTSSVTDMANVAAAAGRSMPNLAAPRSPAPRVPPRLPPRPDRAKLNGPRAFRPPPPPPPRPWARPAPSTANPAIIDEAEYPEPGLSRALLSGRAASVNDLHAAHSPGHGDVRRASAIDVRPPVELEYTDLDVLASRLEGTGREYEGLANITDFLGPGATRGASPAALSSLLLGPVEEESRRIAANGKVKLKLSLLGVRVGKCPICLSQFKENDLAVMLPACGHVGHEECARQWLKRDARCFVCREVLEEVN